MALEISRYDVEVELTEEMLGTVPKDPKVYRTYIATKGRELMEKNIKKGIAPSAKTADSGEEEQAEDAAHRAEEEVATVQPDVPDETIDDIELKGWTGFHSDKDGPLVYDYAIKGFLSEAARTLKEIGTVKQLQDKFKRYVFVTPRRVRLPKPGRIENFEGKPLLIVTPEGVVCERPLRAQTAQGPRVTVVRSDVVLTGTIIKFNLTVLKGGSITKNIISDVLAYGQFIGLGQWRSGGWGRFTVNKLEAL